MIPISIPARAAALALVLASGAGASTAAETTLVAGGPDGARVEFAFQTTPGTARLTVTTHAAGVEGSALTVTVDSSPRPALEHIFAPEECRFPEGGPSRCELVLTDADAALAVILESFRLGRAARISVQDAGVMRMDRELSLQGFSRAIGG